MNNEPIKIKKRGEDDHRIISVRIGLKTLEKIDKLSYETNRSRNELINILLQNAIDNVVIE